MMGRALWKLTITTACFLFLTGALPLLAQDQISLGDSLTDFSFDGTGGATINLTIRSQTFASTSGGLPTDCPGGANWLFGVGSASGSGTLLSAGTVSCNSGYQITSPAQTPLTLTSNGGGSFHVNQSSPLNFTYLSDGSTGYATGTILLQGTITLGNVTMIGCTAPNNCSATGSGALTVTGGIFQSVFTSNTGLVSFTIPLGGDLQTLVNANGSITGQISGSATPGSSVTTSCDFLTGGGWIPNDTATGTPNTPLAAEPGGGNGKATFAIAGGCKHCEPWGQLNYIDHATGMHVEGDPGPTCPVSYYKQPGTTDGNGDPGSQPTGCRHMRGTAVVNGQGGYIYEVIACDNAVDTEDTFGLVVSGNGATYCNPSSACSSLSAGTTGAALLGAGGPGGGTIQLHKGNNSFCCSTGN